MRVKAESLRVGDVVGSGEVVELATVLQYPMNDKLVRVVLRKDGRVRVAQWQRKTMIGVKRNEHERNDSVATVE
jgi:hypothetical protein